MICKRTTKDRAPLISALAITASTRIEQNFKLLCHFKSRLWNSMQLVGMWNILYTIPRTTFEF